ncbi:MAG TPA: protein kinase [Longimicrobium sp.]|nr:protein kinase [Longimicrobium sp.]
MSGLAQIWVGQVLEGRYRLESLVGEGGFSVVFRATDLERGRDVAVKLMDPPRGMGREAIARLRQRFQKEAAVTVHLPLHPNLVRVLGFGTERDVDFLVMELLRGESLKERMANPLPVPLHTALHVLRDAARGVAVGHECGLVHRDLKPANIFLEDAGGAEPHVRILDFGIAKALDDADEEETRTHLTMPGEWFGSEFYSPPEHLRRDAVTRASDVFMLGVVAFELLTRTRLYTREDQNRRRQGLPVPVPSLAARNPQVPAEVERIVRRALAEEPAERYPDAGALAADLHRAVCRLRGAIVPDDATLLVAEDDTDVPGADRTVLAPGLRADDPEVVEIGAAVQKRRRWPLGRGGTRVAAAGVVLVTGTAAGMALTTSRGAAPPPVAAPALTAAGENDAGLRLFRGGEYEEAVQAFDRALRKSPGHAEYMNNRAYALFRAGRIGEGIVGLQEVIAQHPDREVAYSNLAEAQLAQGDTAGAITTLQALLQTDPSGLRRREAHALLSRLGADAWDLREWNDTAEPAVVEEEFPDFVTEESAAVATDTIWWDDDQG